MHAKGSTVDIRGIKSRVDQLRCQLSVGVELVDRARGRRAHELVLRIGFRSELAHPPSTAIRRFASVSRSTRRALSIEGALAL